MEEDAGTSMLARTRFFSAKFFLLLISWELNDRGRDQSATEGDSRSARLSPEPFFFLIIVFTFQPNTRIIRRFYPQRYSGLAEVTQGRPFCPPVRAFTFIAHRVQHSHCSLIFVECRSLMLSRFPPINLYARKSPYEHALGETRTHEIDRGGHADHQPSHQGPWIFIYTWYMFFLNFIFYHHFYFPA